MGSCLTEQGVLTNGQRTSCYTGDPELAGVGACKLGERECSGGTVTSCLGEVMPEVEICNGEDDDCDGETDELSQSSCDTGMTGACTEGELVCRGTRAACDPVVDPERETCDGTDEDCDGETDEDVQTSCYPEGTEGCTANEDGSLSCKGLCKPGMATCTDGVLGACSDMITPAPEVGGVTGRDDDCDGMVDEDVCTEGSSCYGGPDGTLGVGICSSGTLSCPDGTCSDVVPEAETCANMAPASSPDDPAYDDDCNGVVDDVPLLGEPCVDDNKLGVCRSGTYLCESGMLVCATPEPGPEICDDANNDCDADGVDEDFDLLTDEANCGTCGNVCGTGLICCKGVCMNLQTSEDACGICGNACGAGLTCCGGQCVDSTANENHCGACGTSCGEGQQCCGGACVDARADTAHCGACYVACADGQQCCDGTCANACTGCSVTCPEGTTCCGSSCVDRQTDESNCGACGNACAAGQLCCGSTCVDGNTTTHCGTCGNTCNSTQLCCDGMCLASNDAANCGACGNACAAGQLCCGGTCVDGNTTTHCGACSNDCSNGEICSNGTCCLAGQTSCGGNCVDLRTDPSSCGSCGNACLPGEQCRNGCCCKGNQGCRC